MHATWKACVILLGLAAACSSGESVPEIRRTEDAASGPADGGGSSESAAPSNPPLPLADGSTPSDGGPLGAADAGAPEERCARYGAHVATCYNGSVSYYTGWCEWFLKGCPDAHIDQCVASACTDVKLYCGYC